MVVADVAVDLLAIPVSSDERFGNISLARDVIQDGTLISNCALVHGGGGVAFGLDGSLLVSIGDGANADDARGSGINFVGPCIRAFGSREATGIWGPQQATTYRGKIIRLDLATGEPICGNPNFAVDNPYCSSTSAYERRTWASGFRNSFRMAVSPATDETYDGGPGAVSYTHLTLPTIYSV